MSTTAQVLIPAGGSNAQNLRLQGLFVGGYATWRLFQPEARTIHRNELPHIDLDDVPLFQAAWDQPGWQRDPSAAKIELFSWHGIGAGRTTR
jgi:hypothetical protein